MLFTLSSLIFQSYMNFRNPHKTMRVHIYLISTSQIQPCRTFSCFKMAFFIIRTEYTYHMILPFDQRFSRSTTPPQMQDTLEFSQPMLDFQHPSIVMVYTRMSKHLFSVVPSAKEASTFQRKYKAYYNPQKYQIGYGKN